jgi:hypothetical protein
MDVPEKDSRFHENDKKEDFATFYEFMSFRLKIPVRKGIYILQRLSHNPQT